MRSKVSFQDAGQDHTQDTEYRECDQEAVLFRSLYQLAKGGTSGSHHTLDHSASDLHISVISRDVTTFLTANLSIHITGFTLVTLSSLSVGTSSGV